MKQSCVTQSEQSRTVHSERQCSKICDIQMHFGGILIFYIFRVFYFTTY